jgi:hypothetical protein
MKTRLLLVVATVVGCNGSIHDPDGDNTATDAQRGPTQDGQGASAPSSPDPAASPDPASASSGATAAPVFGMTVNNTRNYPALGYGTQRIWDSPPFQWATLQNGPCADVRTCAGAYDATNLQRFDDYLAQLKTNGVGDVWYTMARTPHFVTSAPNDTNCNYGGDGQGGLGQCDRPSDLAADGSGTNHTFRKWYAFFALRNNDSTYRQTHAHIRYWEPWNEPDTAAFWGNGSGGPGGYDPLIRLMQDAECLIVGKVGTGTITKTGETCAQVQASVGLSAPIDPTAIVVSPSYHAKAASLSQYQNFLYCNNAPRTSCTSGDAGARSMMAFNLHMKPGAECVADASQENCTTASALEPAYAGYIKSFEGILKKSELDAFHAGSVPLFDGEASYAPRGFQAPFDDHDLAASFIPRFFLYGRSLGVSGNQWYTWDSIGGNSKVITAWNTLRDAWRGAKLSAPCTSDGTVYQCGFTRNGASYLVLWDISHKCSGGTCATSPQHVSGWRTYQDLTGTESACSTPCPISGDAVPVGIKPVLLAQ